MNKRSSDRLTIVAAENVKEKEYWLETLSGELGRNCFPCNFPRKSKSAAGTDLVKFKFPGKLFLRLMELCNSSDIRLFITMVSGLVILLAR